MDALIQRITHYGGRRPKILINMKRYVSQSVAKTSSHPKATNYDIICYHAQGEDEGSPEQFKAYFLVLVKSSPESCTPYPRPISLSDTLHRIAPRIHTEAGWLPHGSFVTSVALPATSPRNVGDALLFLPASPLP